MNIGKINCLNTGFNSAKRMQIPQKKEVSYKRIAVTDSRTNRTKSLVIYTDGSFVITVPNPNNGNNWSRGVARDGDKFIEYSNENVPKGKEFLPKDVLNLIHTRKNQSPKYSLSVADLF